jgi:hypothetical protein
MVVAHHNSNGDEDLSYQLWLLSIRSVLEVPNTMFLHLHIMALALGPSL